MTAFLCLGMFNFVLVLLALAVFTRGSRKWVLLRISGGLLLAALSTLSLIKVQTLKAERRQALEDGRWAEATVVETEFGYHGAPLLTFRVTSPDCDFEYTDQVSVPFALDLGCSPEDGCPEGLTVPVALVEAPCSRGYADPEAGRFDTWSITTASLIGVAAGMLFVGFGLRQRLS